MLNGDTTSSVLLDDTDMDACRADTGSPPKKGKTSRTVRDRKALSLSSSVLGHSSLLSEISTSLKATNLLSFESVATQSGSQSVHSPTITNGKPKINNSIVRAQSTVAETSSSKSVSFLWRVLGRACPSYHANIYVVSIQTTFKHGKEDIGVRKGQQLKALYRASDSVYVQTPSLEQGFVPYSLCRLSRKHYGAQSTMIALSYFRLYPQSPDGIDSLPVCFIPKIHMVAVKSYSPSSHEEVSAHANQRFTALYCNAEWVYATNGKSSGLLPRSICTLSHESKVHFKSWDRESQPFQSDFVVRYDKREPEILSTIPVPLNSQRTSSKIGKVFTIIQNFAPASQMSGTFTIRKGLRVKVVEEKDSLVRVTTKTGTSFWIPQNHVRPARKSSEADKSTN